MKMIDYDYFSIYLLENCDEFLITFLVEICKEALNSNEISSFNISEIYDTLCILFNREFEFTQYKKDIEDLVNQRVLIENVNHLEMRYNFGDLPKSILSFINEFLKEVEETKEFIRRIFKEDS